MAPAEIPPPFAERLRRELGRAAADRVLATMGAAKDCAYWVNALRDGELPSFGVPVPGLADVFACASADRARLVRHPAATSGRIYLLNPASVVAVLVLAPLPGEVVLDLAAAPGGKTVLAAARMGNTGAIVAVESAKRRFHRMVANLERCGVRIAECRWQDGRDLGRAGERFDRVLLDAPCASEARFRRAAPTSWRHWSPRKVREAANKQRGLLRAAFRCLKPGGALVYCTCSFSLRENERAVGYLLRREPTARLLPLPASNYPNAEPGVLAGTLRIRPDRLFDGLFLARLTKLLGRRVAP